MTVIILGLLVALSSPLILLPIEKFLPYPSFIEEFVKLIIVLIVIKAARQFSSWVWVLIAGFLFALSESILYLINIFALGDLTLFPKRLILTSGLHICTMILMYFLGKKSYLGLLIGFIVAILIHHFFNLLMANIYGF